MKSVPRYWRPVLGIGALTILLGTLWMGCNPKQETPPAVRGDTTATLPQLDDKCPRGEPPTTPEQLDACRKGFTFDEQDLAGDQQRLMVFDSLRGPLCPGARTIRNCRLGPLATIQPEVHSYQWSDSTVRKEGRIIARLFLDDKEKVGYPKLALVPGHQTYWWVQIGPDGKTGRSFYISDSVKADGTLLNVKRGLEVERYREKAVKAIARWLWLADDETGKGTCTSTSSCK